MKTVKRYFAVSGPELLGLGQKIAGRLQERFKLRTSITEVAGGRDGDLYEEIAQLRVFSVGFDSSIQLYWVCDDNTSGRAERLSVIFRLNDHESEMQEAQPTLDLLDDYGFVNKCTCMSRRPGSSHSFQDFLLEWCQPKYGAPFDQAFVPPLLT